MNSGMWEEGTVVKVYFGTNRKADRKRSPRDFGHAFSEDGLANLRFGMAEVGGEDPDEFELYVAPEKLRDPERLREDKERRFIDGGGAVLGSENIFRRVREKMIRHARDTLVFIHGYNVTFREALTSAARLKLNFSTDRGGPGVNVVLFS